MDWIGWTIGVAGIAYAIFTDYNARKQRERLHSFLKGLKPGIGHGDPATILKAINDEMGSLIHPKAAKD